MMVQSIIVFLIMVICILYIGKSIYNSITGRKKNPCGGCSGCALKDKIDNCSKKTGRNY